MKTQARSIFVSRENAQERESILEIQQALLPWSLTRPAQGDDFGRDGFLQIVDETNSSVGPLIAVIQAKSIRTAFCDLHVERLESRHLDFWSRPESPSTLLIIWSQHSKELRIRTAREIRSELQTTKSGWQEQKTVSVHFRGQTEFLSTRTSRMALMRRIQDEADQAGGKSCLSTYTRRVLLSDLYLDTESTSQRIEVRQEDDKLEQLFCGTGWVTGEVNPRDIYAPRVLAAALLLYEESWFPAKAIPVVAKIMGPELLERAVVSKRLVPYRFEPALGLMVPRDEVLGELTAVTPDKERSLRTLESGCSDLSKELTGRKELGKILWASIRLIEDIDPILIIRETKKDLARGTLRSLLGLGATKNAGAEAVWDYPLVNRVLQMNAVMAIGDSVGTDVVELEGGMSRLASEKWYSSLGFNRLYRSAAAFDTVLRSCGVPDLGLLVRVLGFRKCFEIADSPRCQIFRDWFWSTASALVDAGIDLSDGFIGRLAEASGLDCRAYSIPSELKLRFVQKIGSAYVVGSPLNLPRTGVATRADGDRVLARQAVTHFRRRGATIKSRFGGVGRNRSCPCGSNRKYKSCCGRRPTGELK